MPPTFRVSRWYSSSSSRSAAAESFGAGVAAWVVGVVCEENRILLAFADVPDKNSKAENAKKLVNAIVRIRTGSAGDRNGCPDGSCCNIVQVDKLFVNFGDTVDGGFLLLLRPSLNNNFMNVYYCKQSSGGSEEGRNTN